MKELKRVPVTAVIEHGTEGEKTQEDFLVLFDKQDKDYPGERCVYMEHGMTGYESFNVEPESEFFKKWMNTAMVAGWFACTGGSGWHSYFIPPEDMKKAIDELGLLELSDGRMST